MCEAIRIKKSIRKISMEKRVMAYIDKNHMLEKKDKVIVGVSGGADSVCLLFMLNTFKRRYDISVYAVHVNHCIRGAEADEDEQFVRKLCERLGVAVSIYKYDVPALSAEKGISEEEMGRIVRYEAFRDARSKYSANKIATAHHMDDNAETMLFNLFRGTGLRGLAGIPPVRNEIIRPLMCLDRAEIEAYLDYKGEAYRMDSTNLCDDYTRNRIRHNILPYARETIVNSLSKHMADTAAQLRLADDYLKAQAKKAAINLVQYEKYAVLIDKKKFAAQHPALKGYIIADIWNTENKECPALGRRHLDIISALADEPAGKSADLPGGYKAISTYGYIVIYNLNDHTEKNGEIVEAKIPGNVHLGNGEHVFSFKKEKFTGEFKKISKATYTKCFDYDKINSHPVLRTRMKNDYIVINSDNEKQSLNRYFINQKIPAQVRDRILLLADGNKIIWVVGFRISEDVKITEATKTMLIVTREID